MNVAPTILEGRALRLEPLAAAHAADLARHADREIFRYLLSAPEPFDERGFKRYIEAQIAQPARVAFAIRLREIDQCIGSSSYLDIRPEHRGLEIGHTWIARPWHGTHVNAELKLLMLRHAFDEQGCVRVQLKTDGRNLHSQRAMEKLGCVREGVLRKHVILPDGFVRDTVMYSITDAEWPRVRDGLIGRLSYDP